VVGNPEHMWGYKRESKGVTAGLEKKRRFWPVEENNFCCVPLL